MRCLIVHNAKSGFGSSAIFEFERALLREGDECTTHILDERETGASALANAENYDLVVVSGGDGTTASLLYDLRFRNVLTCVFPSGTANLFCINLGNAVEPSSLARACRIGRSIKTDIGELRYVDDANVAHTCGFDIMVGTGFDAQIMHAAVENKQAFGEAAYFAAAFTNAFPPVHHFKIDMDGTTIECDGIGCLVANNSTIQGDIRIVPNGSMTDGLLDVIVLQTTHAVGLLRPLMASIMDKNGNLFGRPVIKTYHARHVVVTTPEPVPLEYDGEPAGLVMSYEAQVLAGANLLVVDGLSPYRDPEDPYTEKNPRFGRAHMHAYPKI